MSFALQALDRRAGHSVPRGRGPGRDRAGQTGLRPQLHLGRQEGRHEGRRHLPEELAAEADVRSGRVEQFFSIVHLVTSWMEPLESFLEE